MPAQMALADSREFYRKVERQAAPPFFILHVDQTEGSST
jgi:hypothetical protein